MYQCIRKQFLDIFLYCYFPLNLQPLPSLLLIRVVAIEGSSYTKNPFFTYLIIGYHVSIIDYCVNYNYLFTIGNLSVVGTNTLTYWPINGSRLNQISLTSMDEYQNLQPLYRINGYTYLVWSRVPNLWEFFSGENEW